MRVALITGATTGIGLETALLFARRGYRVYAGARKPQAAHLLQEAQSAGLPVRVVALDVDRDDSVARAVEEVLADAGAIDVLVNNAGIGMAGPVELVPLDAARAVFETNLYGAVRLMQAVVPGMRERRSGAIVNVTSVMGRVTLGGHGFYAASKFALAAVSESLAVEMKPFGVRVAIVEPGVVLTPIWSKESGVKLPAGHPYPLPMARLWRLFQAQLEDGTLPDAVAAAILRAVETEDPKVRYPVGADAEVCIEARERVGATAWVELQGEMDEDRFVERAAEVFGVDLYNGPSLNGRRKGAGAGA